MKSYRKFLNLFAMLVILTVAFLLFQTCTKPQYDIRMCAEWEAAAGTIIAWPLKVPRKLVEGLSEKGILWVLVAGEKEKEKADSLFTEWGIDRVKPIITTVETEWTRDYGAHQVFNREGFLEIIDPIYINTPAFLADNPPVNRGDSLDYLGQRFPGDDRTNIDVAVFFRLPYCSMPGYLTGGNFIVDGHGNAFASRAMLDENNVLMSDEEFLAMVEEYTGVSKVHVMENTEDRGIQHIDCWFKLLNEETMLIKRAPEGHPEYERIERNVEKLRSLKSCYGRPYEIIRIDCPPYRTVKSRRTGNEVQLLPAYTNSYILNRTVFVPLFNGPGDEAALETYKKALPGYEIRGIKWEGWYHFDALHCRTRALFIHNMLRVTHKRLRDGQPAGKPLKVTVTINDYSRMEVSEDKCSLKWRPAGDEKWNRVPLQRDGSDSFKAEIPEQTPGSIVEYYIAAASKSRHTEGLPRTAPKGFYTFVVTN